MSKGTDPITHLYTIDGHEVAITRRHTHTAYARNGNVGNPTEYFVWEFAIDGEYVYGALRNRRDAYENARCYIHGLNYRPYAPSWENVRNFRLVDDEMKANYAGRAKVKT